MGILEEQIQTFQVNRMMRSSRSKSIVCTCVDGWLNRYGKFYPCRFNHHLSVASKLEKKLGLKSSLEYLGWIKIHSAGVYFFKADEYYGRCVRITESQNKWLLDNGYI